MYQIVSLLLNVKRKLARGSCCTRASETGKVSSRRMRHHNAGESLLIYIEHPCFPFFSFVTVIVTVIMIFARGLCRQFQRHSFTRFSSSATPTTAATTATATTAAKTHCPTMALRSKRQNPPRLSSSLLLLDHQNRILLVQRSHSKSMSFSSALVFPGGNLDPTQDGFLLPPSSKSLPLPTTLHPSPDTDQLDLPPDLVTALKTCAIRETFEETAILLAHPQSSRDQVIPELADSRAALLEGSTTFPSLLAQHSLRIDPAQDLHLFTTWITPSNLPRRYRTLMFLAVLPPGTATANTASLLPSTSDDEIVQRYWIHPREVLAKYYSQSSVITTHPANRLILFPPQLYLLHHLSIVLSDAQSSSTKAADSYTRLLQYTKTSFAKQVIQPYSKRVLNDIGKDQGKTLLGVDRPRGDTDVWIKVRPGKGGPREVEVVGRSVGEGEGEGEGRGQGGEDKSESKSGSESARTEEKTAKL